MARVNYSKVAPEDTFLGRYMSYMSEQETPSAYDFWSAIWLLGVACGRDVVVARPRAPVYLNWYCLFVADSGVTRKSTAVRFATKVARAVLEGSSTTLIETKTTPEMLEYLLQQSTVKHGHAQAVISISELVTFLGSERYAKHMPGLLTDLYDAPELRMGGGTLARGSARLEKVYVSFLSASTPAWLLRAINPDVVEGGFTSRCMFIVAEQRKRKAAWPSDDADGMAVAFNELVGQLREIRDRVRSVPSISINEGGKKRFTAWYNSRPQNRDPFRASFESREDAHILRLAACLAINDGTWDIQDRHVNQAIKIITEVKEDGAAIFVGGVHASKTVLAVDKIRELLVEAGLTGLAQSDLSVACKNLIDAEGTRAILDVMHNLGMVQCFEGVQLGKGRPKTIWRATTKITASKAMDLVIERMGP